MFSLFYLSSSNTTNTHIVVTSMTAKQRDLLINWSDFYYGRGACSSRARAISHFAFICDYIVQNVGGLRRRTASILHHSCLLCCRFLRLRARGNALGARGDCSAAQNETHICYCSGNVLSVLRATLLPTQCRKGVWRCRVWWIDYYYCCMRRRSLFISNRRFVRCSLVVR